MSKRKMHYQELTKISIFRFFVIYILPKSVYVIAIEYALVNGVGEDSPVGQQEFSPVLQVVLSE